MSNTQRKQNREALIEAIPWVVRLTFDVPCEGIKWSKVALKHLYSMGGRPAEGIPDRAHCTFRAKWHYTAPDDPETYAKTGDYCIHHLMVQFDDPVETERYQRWRNSKETPDA
jgi:hypothetical protein